MREFRISNPSSECGRARHAKRLVQILTHMQRKIKHYKLQNPKNGNSSIVRLDKTIDFTYITSDNLKGRSPIVVVTWQVLDDSIAPSKSPAMSQRA